MGRDKFCSYLVPTGFVFLVREVENTRDRGSVRVIRLYAAVVDRELLEVGEDGERELS